MFPNFRHYCLLTIQETKAKSKSEPPGKLIVEIKFTPSDAPVQKIDFNTLISNALKKETEPEEKPKEKEKDKDKEKEKKPKKKEPELVIEVAEPIVKGSIAGF